MEISWTNHEKDEGVLNRVQEDRKLLHTIRRRRAIWIGHSLRRNCLLKHVIERKIEGRMAVKKRGWKHITRY
jgi:hypothetical protein